VFWVPKGARYFIRSRILVITDPNAHRNKIEI
jgi:hypothetical protein